MKNDCPCPKCRRAQHAYERLQARVSGLFPRQLDAHKFDYLHAEDAAAWKFEYFCCCELCQAERTRLRSRQY